MKASELRIGNMIKSLTPLTSYCIVDEISTSRIVSRSYPKHTAITGCNIGTFEPIPLTEEWLHMFGATLIPIAEGSIFKFGLLHLLRSANFSYLCSFNPDDNKSWFKEIKYVHQLQNLYFALTGEELIAIIPAV